MKKLLSTVVLAIAGFTTLIPATSHAQSSASPYTSATRYDSVGRVVGTIAPDPDGSGPLKHLATRTTYDTRGNVTKVETGELSSWRSEAVLPANWGSAFTVQTTAETSYDSLNRRLTDRTKDADGDTISLTQYSYDSLGRLECTAVRMNPIAYNSLPSSACSLGTPGSYGPDRITKTVYDAAGQVLQMRRAVGTSIEIADVTYSYTPNGQIKQIVDANGNRAELRYDGHDRQNRWVFPSKTRPGSFNDATPTSAMSSAGALNNSDYEAYTYDNNGNRLSLRKRDGSVISYQYDALNRMTLKDLPYRADLSSSRRRDVYYTYDLRGLQTSARFSPNTGAGNVFTYDGFGRVTAETQYINGAWRTIGSQYDANGNRTRVDYNHDGVYWAYGYDGLNRMTDLAYRTENLGGPIYNARGLMSSLKWSSATVQSNRTNYGYDAANRLNQIGINLNGSSYDVNWSYTRNPASQIRTEGQSNDAYSWDGHVNLNRSYTTNGLNQYTAAGSASFTYDANGNLTSDGTNTYVYDIENRLTHLTKPGGGYANLFYDPAGRLSRVQDSQTGQQTDFVYDGNALAYEIKSSTNQVMRTYAHGSNAEADDPLVVLERQESGSGWHRRHIHTDPRGSVVALTNWRGDAYRINSYDEYGIPDQDTQNPSGDTIADKGRFRYTGQAWIPELGMYYYKARIYSPTLGRFLQTDPIGYEDQYNLYAYVANDPVNAVDFTGQNAIKLFIKRTVQHRGNVVEAAIDVADTAVTVFAPSSTPLERVVAVAELVSPVAPSDVKAIRNGIEAAGGASGGRKGSAATRAQNEAIGNRINSEGGRTTGGFNQGPETRFAGPNGGNRGSRFSDGSAVDRDGNGFQVQTVDTRADGSLTTREANAARDIAERSGQPVVCVAKERCN